MLKLKPPAHLGPESRRLWSSVVAEYELESHHLAILERACEALDRLRQAQAAIAGAGLLVDGRYGPRVNPAVSVETASRAAFLRAVHDLGLDISAPPSGAAQTAAARLVRWSK